MHGVHERVVSGESGDSDLYIYLVGSPILEGEALHTYVVVVAFFLALIGPLEPLVVPSPDLKR